MVNIFCLFCSDIFNIVWLLYCKWPTSCSAWESTHIVGINKCVYVFCLKDISIVFGFPLIFSYVSMKWKIFHLITQKLSWPLDDHFWENYPNALSKLRSILANGDALVSFILVNILKILKRIHLLWYFSAFCGSLHHAMSFASFLSDN